MASADKRKKDVADEDDDDEKTQSEAPGKKRSLLPIILVVAVVVLLLAGGGAAAYFFLMQGQAPAAVKTAPAQAKSKAVVFWPMDPFIVNLLDNDGERYLKVVMQIELADVRMLEEAKTLNPRLRDTILDLLSSKAYKEMMDPLGKQRLREEIILRMNAILNSPNGKVLKVYFTEFVIQ